MRIGDCYSAVINSSVIDIFVFLRDRMVITRSPEERNNDRPFSGPLITHSSRRRC